MKKVVFAGLLSIVATAAFAQSNINKGDWMVGGNASFTYEKDQLICLCFVVGRNCFCPEREDRLEGGPECFDPY